MNTTVRTLQYYDHQGLLSPSAASEGGRRLYSDKDIIKLHQIQSLKYLGFSLSDIKDKLPALDTPAEVAAMLNQLANSIEEKISVLTDSLGAISVLKTEVLKMQMVDFRRYADIIINLQMKNEYYWLIKHFDNETLDLLSQRFDSQKAQAMNDALNILLKRAIQYQDSGVDPEGEAGQELAKQFWDKMLEFTNGDMVLFNKIVTMAENANDEEPWKTQVATANNFIEPALGYYFLTNNIDPFQSEQEKNDKRQ